MRGYRISRDGDAVQVRLADLGGADLGVGDTEFDVAYSSVNYKDGLAFRGAPGVMRTDPLVPGIDAVGTVVSSGGPWHPGDSVVLNGWGAGETRPGGLAERMRVPAEWLVRLPEGLGLQRAAAVGTAGLTAMLAVLAIGERDGDVLVTGASGGVGSIAVALLAGRGHRVVAATGRPEGQDYLRRLGAAEVIDRNELAEPGRPLQSERWAAAVDVAGGHTLANVLAQTKYGGVVAACGLAQGGDLPGTVMPFILRGVTLAGVDSVYAPLERRRRAWERLAAELDPGLLDSLTTVVDLEQVPHIAERVLAGQVRGRTVVRVR